MILWDARTVYLDTEQRAFMIYKPEKDLSLETFCETNSSLTHSKRFKGGDFKDQVKSCM